MFACLVSSAPIATINGSIVFSARVEGQELVLPGGWVFEHPRVEALLPSRAKSMTEAWSIGGGKLSHCRHASIIVSQGDYQKILARLRSHRYPSGSRFNATWFELSTKQPSVLLSTTEPLESNAFVFVCRYFALESQPHGIDDAISKLPMMRALVQALRAKSLAALTSLETMRLIDDVDSVMATFKIDPANATKIRRWLGRNGFKLKEDDFWVKDNLSAGLTQRELTLTWCGADSSLPRE